MTAGTHSDLVKEADRLEAIVISMNIPREKLAALRQSFPEIRFVTPAAEDDDSGAPFQIAYRESPSIVMADADALIGWEISPAALAAAPRLRWIHAASAGIEHFDLAAIAARGIVMTNSRGVHAPNIAEHVLAMMLALTRRLPRLGQAQTAREWRDTATHAEVGELMGQTVLIVGLGEIGRAVAERAAGFGMRVHAVRRSPAHNGPPAVERTYPVSALTEALAAADHVVVTLPDTRDSRGLFDVAAFAAMKPGAKIYNVGRGTTIDTAALTAALQSGGLGGAGLDVTDPEPLPPDSPLWAMEQVLITAHTAGATPRYWDRLEPLLADNIRRWQTGEPLRNLVDLDAGY